MNVFDIWVAEDGGWPVALNVDISVDLSAFGEELEFPLEEAAQQVRVTMRMDITDPNSPDIHVEPPVP